MPDIHPHAIRRGGERTMAVTMIILFVLLLVGGLIVALIVSPTTVALGIALVLLIFLERMRAQHGEDRACKRPRGAANTQAHESTSASKGEVCLLDHVRRLFRTKVKQEYSPDWLSQQRIDVAVSRRKLAFEYHGTL